MDCTVERTKPVDSSTGDMHQLGEYPMLQNISEQLHICTTTEIFK